MPSTKLRDGFAARSDDDWAIHRGVDLYDLPLAKWSHPVEQGFSQLSNSAILEQSGRHPVMPMSPRRDKWQFPCKR
jgi:hypothetical protein